jgi:hypothetical protein
MTQNGQQKNFGLKNLFQDLINTAEMTNHAPTTNLGSSIISTLTSYFP